MLCISRRFSEDECGGAMGAELVRCRLLPVESPQFIEDVKLSGQNAGAGHHLVEILD